MTTTYTVSLELTAEQAKWMKLMVKQQCPTAKFSKARAAVAKAAGDGKKVSVNDLPMDKPVYLTEQAEKAKAGTAFADRKKQVYKKLQGKTIEEMMKGVADRIATLRREKNDLLIVLKDYDARFKERNGRGIRDDGYSPVSAQYYHYKKLRKEIKEMEETAEIGVQTDE